MSSFLICFCFLVITTNSFHVETTKKTWSAANAYCQSQYNTHLISIIDATMNTHIFDSIISDSWIGYYNPTHGNGKIESNWQWIGYKNSTYINWIGGEPNNYHGNEWCVEIMRRGDHRDAGWNDRGCSSSRRFVCASIDEYQSLHPTVHPTKSPSIHPTVNPTQSPTNSPTFAVTFDIHNSAECDNLHEYVYIDYDKDFNQCKYLCIKSGIECKLFNYFQHFKEINDSRCYIFDKLCNIKITNNNNSIIAFSTFTNECLNYPLNWKDNTGDDCNYYSSKNWCKNETVLRNENEFYNLVDVTYGLTAIDTCCDCGGGVRIMDNVAFSFDNDWSVYEDDVLCGWTNTDFTLHLENQTTLRTWDNLILYDMCNDVDGVNCNFLIDTQFESTIYSYSLYLCNQYQHDQVNFIFDIIIDEINKTYEIYVNSLWFTLQISHYSSNIDIIYLNNSYCTDNIDNRDTNRTYIYGAHPCYLLDSVIPTPSPTEQNVNSAESAFMPYVEWIVVIVVSLILCLLILSVYCYCKKKNKSELDDHKEKQLQMEMHAMSFKTGNNADHDVVHRASAPPLHDNEDESNVYCIVCCEYKANMFNDPCGHVTYCNKCALVNVDNKCPICRATIKCKRLYNAGFSSNYYM